MPSAPHGTKRALIRPRNILLHNSEPAPTPTEKIARNSVTIVSSPPSTKRT